MIYLTWKSLSQANEYRPFIFSIVIFLCSYIGIAISMYPYLVPYQITFWEAAAPDSTLKFLLIGVIIILPILFAYTLYAYRVFKGKTSHHGYH